MEIGILDKSFICVIQPVIKALFGNADMTADSDAVEYTLFYQIICCGTTDTQNVLNLIDRIGSFVIADRILFIKAVQFRNSSSNIKTPPLSGKWPYGASISSGI